MKAYALALVPIIGAAVLLCGQPYTNSNLLNTNAPSVADLIWRGPPSYVSADTNPMVYFYTNHEVFIADSRYGPTNIVISNDYKGTIQVGTNFWRVDEIGVKTDCAKRGHSPYKTRCVWIGNSGPVEGPCFKCAVCGKEIAQQPGEWK